MPARRCSSALLAVLAAALLLLLVVAPVGSQAQATPAADCISIHIAMAQECTPTIAQGETPT